jgi:hypothetical protein
MNSTRAWLPFGLLRPEDVPKDVPRSASDVPDGFHHPASTHFGSEAVSWCTLKERPPPRRPLSNFAEKLTRLFLKPQLSQQPILTIRICRPRFRSNLMKKFVQAAPARLGRYCATLKDSAYQDKTLGLT